MNKQNDNFDNIVMKTTEKFTDQFNTDSVEFELVKESLNQGDTEMKPCSIWSNFNATTV